MAITNERLVQAVKDSKSYSQVLNALRLSKSGRAINFVKKKVSLLEIDISHFEKQITYGGHKKRLHWTKILVNNPYLYDRRTGRVLTRALVESGREYVCESCKLTEWLGKEIKLEVHHIDGNWRNNSQENLQFLCPNCHACTENFFNKGRERVCKCGKKVSRWGKSCPSCAGIDRGITNRKVERPTKEVLEKLIWEKPTQKIALQFKVSDKAVEKWCKSYGIAKPPRGYWQKQQSISASANTLR